MTNDHTERRRDSDKEEGNVMSDFKGPMVVSKYSDYNRHRQTKTQTVLSDQFAEGSQCSGICSYVYIYLLSLSFGASRTLDAPKDKDKR